MKCGNGIVVYVYRDPRDAVPIYVEGIQAQGKLSATLADNAKAELSGKYQEQIIGLTKLVTNQTESLLSAFSIIYSSYADNPCTRDRWFLNRVDNLLSETWRFQRIKLHLDTIIALAKKNAKNQEVISVFHELTKELSRPSLNQLVESEIKQAPLLVNQWRQP